MDHPVYISAGNGNLRGKKLTVSNTKVMIRPEHRKEFFQTIATVSDKISREKGCMSFRFFEETGNENSVILVSEWESATAWQIHCHGANFAVVHGSVQTLGIGSKIEYQLLTILENE